MNSENPPSSRHMESSKVRMLLRKLAKQSQDYLLNKEEEYILLFGYQNGIMSDKCMEALIRMNIRLVRGITGKYATKNGISSADLESCGLEGLMVSIQRFDLSTGNRFSTYAVYWITNRVRKYLTNQHSTIRVPNHVWDKINLLRRSIGKLSTNGNYPSQEQLSADTGLTQYWVNECLEIMGRVIVSSSEDVVLDGIGISKSEALVADESADGELLSAAARDNLLDSLDVLTPRQRQMLLMYIGWDNERMTLNEVGEHFGISREAVRQNIARAIGLLRTKYDLEDLIHDTKISRGFAPYLNHHMG